MILTTTNTTDAGLGYLWRDMPTYLTRNLAYEAVILGAYYGMYELFNEDLKKSSAIGVSLMALRLLSVSCYNAIYNRAEDHASPKRKVDPIHWFEFLFCLTFALLAVLRDNEDFLKVQPAISSGLLALSIFLLPYMTKTPFCKTMFGNLLEKYYPAHRQKIESITDREWKNVDIASITSLLLTAGALLAFGKFCPDDLWIYLKYPVIIGCTLPGVFYSYRILKPHLAGEVTSTAHSSPAAAP